MILCNRGDGEEEEYDFEYSDEEEEETDVDLENSYYAAKGLKQEDPRAAVEAFREVTNKLDAEMGRGGRGVGGGGCTHFMHSRSRTNIWCRPSHPFNVGTEHVGFSLKGEGRGGVGFFMFDRRLYDHQTLSSLYCHDGGIVSVVSVHGAELVGRGGRGGGALLGITWALDSFLPITLDICIPVMCAWP